MVALAEVSCPRCGTRMEYRVEIEFKNNGKVVRYYYWCPRCGYRVNDLTVNVSKDGSKVRVMIEKYSMVKRG